MDAERRRQLLDATALGRTVPSDADSVGMAGGKLDPDGRWITVSGTHVHTNAKGEPDSGEDGGKAWKERLSRSRAGKSDKGGDADPKKEPAASPGGADKDKDKGDKDKGDKDKGDKDKGDKDKGDKDKGGKGVSDGEAKEVHSRAGHALEVAAGLVDRGTGMLYALCHPASAVIAATLSESYQKAHQEVDAMAERYGRAGAHLIAAQGSFVSAWMPPVVSHLAEHTPVGRALTQLPALALAEAALQSAKGTSYAAGLVKSGFSRAVSALRSAVSGKAGEGKGGDKKGTARLGVDAWVPCGRAMAATFDSPVPLTAKLLAKESQALARRIAEHFHEGLAKRAKEHPEMMAALAELAKSKSPKA